MLCTNYIILSKNRRINSQNVSNPNSLVPKNEIYLDKAILFQPKKMVIVVMVILLHDGILASPKQLLAEYFYIPVVKK